MQTTYIYRTILTSMLRHATVAISSSFQPARKSVTWSSRCSCAKWGMRLAYSINWYNCLLTIWHKCDTAPWDKVKVYFSFNIIFLHITYIQFTMMRREERGNVTYGACWDNEDKSTDIKYESFTLVTRLLKFLRLIFEHFVSYTSFSYFFRN